MSKLRLLHRAYSALLKPVAFGASPTKHRAPIAASVFHCSALKSGPQPGRGRDGPASQLAVGVEVTPCGKKLCVSWEGDDDRDPVFHGVWLRHNCQCPLCLSSSGQKTLDKVHLDPKLTIVETSLQGLIMVYALLNLEYRIKPFSFFFVVCRRHSACEVFVWP